MGTGTQARSWGPEHRTFGRSWSSLSLALAQRRAPCLSGILRDPGAFCLRVSMSGIARAVGFDDTAICGSSSHEQFEPAGISGSCKTYLQTTVLSSTILAQGCGCYEQIATYIRALEIWTDRFGNPLSLLARFCFRAGVVAIAKAVTKQLLQTLLLFRLL